MEKILEGGKGYISSLVLDKSSLRCLLDFQLEIWPRQLDTGVRSSGERFDKEFKFRDLWHKDGAYSHESGRNYNENSYREGRGQRLFMYHNVMCISSPLLGNKLQ